MAKPRVLLLGFTVPNAIARNLFDLDVIPSVQTHKFAWSLARALKAGFGEVVLASACSIQNYPLGRKVVFFSEEFEEHEVKGVLLGFINLLVLKHFTRFISCVLNVPQLLMRYKIDWVFIHGTHTPFLFFGLLARVFGKKLVIVITDPPGVLQPADSKLAKILKRIDIWLVSFALARANAVVALAPELIECFAKNKPSLVFPGIVNSDLVEHLSKASPLDTSSREFTIVYAGGLSKAYGVDRLLSAIAMIKEKRVCLKLFGRGELEEKIKALAESLDCIQYGGFIGSDKLIPELCSADLLINPRPTQDAFAVMSFPSKLIEYLAIGSPVLTTRIASIPDSYKPYFFFIDDESEEGIRESILRMIKMDFAYRKKHALQGQEFIQTEASEMAVGNKIAGFIGSISLGDVNDQNKTR